MNRIENIYEVTQRLCGEIEPVGDSNIDRIRLQNLKDTIDVTESLIQDIIDVSKNKVRYESSMKVSGNTANSYLKELREQLNQLEL